MFTPIRRTLAGLAIAVVAVAGAAACEAAPPKTCEGLDATITGSGQAITGTSGDDVIIGTNGAEAINGLGGNDKICAAGGNDTITGGPGNDVIDGGSGTDRTSYAAAPGPVVVNLATGSATGDGTDTLKALEGAIGTAAGDTFTGNAAANTFDGGAGSDTFNTAGGSDTCALGTGVDQATDCEAITGNVANLSEQDQLDYTVTNGERISSMPGPSAPAATSVGAPPPPSVRHGRRSASAPTRRRFPRPTAPSAARRRPGRHRLRQLRVHGPPAGRAHRHHRHERHRGHRHDDRSGPERAPHLQRDRRAAALSPDDRRDLRGGVLPQLLQAERHAADLRRTPSAPPSGTRSRST